MTDIHASCVCWQNRGILLLGASGSGKSDLCLRLISGQGAELVADDRVDLIVSRETIYASAPEILAGMLEIRGVGLLKLPNLRRSRLDLAVELVSAPQEVERLPLSAVWEFGGCKLPLLRLYPFEASAPDKILAALRWPPAVK